MSKYVSGCRQHLVKKNRLTHGIEVGLHQSVDSEQLPTPSSLENSLDSEW